MFIDSFSGKLADLKTTERTDENAIAILRKHPMVSTWDMSEKVWLRNLIYRLKKSGAIIELECDYPWHKYQVTGLNK